MANGGTQGRAPELSRKQAARVDRHNQWKRERDAILREALDAFKAGDMDGFLALDAKAKALPEPDIFNG